MQYIELHIKYHYLQLLQQIQLYVQDYSAVQLNQLQFTGHMKQEKIRYSYSFFDKFGIQFKIPNSNDLVLRNRDTQQLILMKDIQVTPAQYEQTLATLDYQKKLSHEQLLGLLDYHAQPTIHKFIVLYEYCHISLMEQFQNRLAQRRYFQQPQLWSIFTSLVFGLAYLQEKNVGHGSISLIDCFLNQQGFIKISDPTCATSNPYNIVKGYYYGPQILRCLIQQTTEQINIFKSDMFALGCCMLQLSLMRQITDVIDYENGVINKVQLKGLLSDLAGLGLTKQYVSFLNQSLILDSHKRPDFITLKAQIFYLLSLGNTEQSQQLMRQSYGIKSSLSSLCRSKGEKSLKQIAKKDIELLENKKIQKVNFTLEGLLQTTADKNRQPLAQMQRSNEKNLIDFTFFGEKPNVDYIFGNMKKSITLQKQPQYNLPTEQKKRQKKQQKQNMVLNRTHILNNQYTYKQQKTCKSHRKPMQDTLYFQQNIEFGAQKNKKRRQSQLPYRGFNKQSCHSITIEKGICQKALIIRKQIQQLFSQSPLNTTKQSYLQQKTMYSSQIKKSTFNSLQNDQMYTDPSFLQMMRADVEQILHKRMNLF